MSTPKEKANYHKKYKETIATLALVYGQLDFYERQEKKVLKLLDFTAYIEELGVQVKAMPDGENKEKAKERIKRLIEIHNTYSEFYFSQLVHRLKEAEVQKQYHELLQTHKELHDEYEKLKRLYYGDNWENQEIHVPNL